MIAERELFSFLLRGKFCPFFIPVGQFEMPALFQKKDHKIGEQKQHELGFHISFGISLPSSDIFMLHQLKKQSVQALNCRSALGGNSLIMYSEIQIFKSTIRKKPMKIAAKVIVRVRSA